MKRLLLALAAVFALGAIAPACVDDVGLVDRTSANKIDKTLLEGVWIYGITTIDAPYSSAVSFTGQSHFGASSKIIFDVQESLLIAYPIVETVDGSEKDWKRNKIRKYWDPAHRDEFVEIFVGQPIATWPITKHFDVIRAYSTYNGAQSNELVENTTDRPWYMRDHFRVDWSGQSLTQFRHSLAGGVGSVSYYVGEDKQSEPDALLIDLEGGYFDYTVRSIATSTGQYACNIYGLSAYDCAPAELRARHSFQKLDPARDYQPIRYHNNEHMDKFGYFLTERHAYDRDWGPTYEGKVSFANRWNLWDRTYDYDKPTDEAGAELTISCFADAECDRDAGERCQKTASWFEDGYCAIPNARPFKDRGQRPIIYHLNADWHPDYLDEAYQAADNWSDVFKDAVAWALFYDEKGLSETRACAKHSDCGTPGLLIDAPLNFFDAGLACFDDTQCPGSNLCGDEGYCGAIRQCDDANPCALGQTCGSGQCSVNGTPIFERAKIKRALQHTVVYTTGGQAVITDDALTATQLSRAQAEKGAWVRFIHADVDGGDLGLRIGGTNMAGGAFDIARSYDPADPATESFMAFVPEGAGLDFDILGGADVLATKKGDIFPGNTYLVVFNGTDVVITGAPVSAADGARVIHVSAGEGRVDFGLAGVLVDAGVEYKRATPYRRIAGDIQRVTLTRAGTRGDVTCYVEDTVGTCTGWPFDITDADTAHVAELKANLPEMFILCQNQYDALDALVTVAEEDQTSTLNDSRYTYDVGGQPYNPCGDEKWIPHPEEMKRIGDLRYNFYYWVNETQRAGPLGYGPSLADPETGEMITGNAYIYGGSMHTYGQYAADLIDLVNGDLDTENVIIGDHVREYFKNHEDDVQPDTGTYKGALVTGLTADKNDGHRFGHSHGHAHGVDATQNHAGAAAMVRPTKMIPDYAYPEFVELASDPAKFQALLQDTLPQMDPTHYHDRLGMIKGTAIEEMLINDEVRLAGHGIDPEGKLSPAELRAKLSPTEWATKYAMKTEEERMQFLSNHNLYMGEFVDDAMFGIAQELKGKGLWGDSLRLEIARRILGEVLEHEIGHTIGLRHNFSGSTDVFNFLDPYYSIREPEVVICQDDGWCDEINFDACAVQSCTADADCITGLFCNAGECSGPSGDPSVAALVPTGVCASPIEDQNCSSDADCGAGNLCFEAECMAPVKKFVPRAWLTSKERSEGRTEYQYTTVMDYGGRVNHGIHGLGKYDYAAVRFAYTGLVDTYANPKNLYKRVENAVERQGGTAASYSFALNTNGWPTRGTGFWHAFNYLNYYIGIEENLQRVPRPYTQVKTQRAMVVTDARQYIDIANIEVPYAFCSDEYRGNMGCYYFDMGIDPGEMAGHAAEQLEQYYIFDAFRRERLYFGQYGNPMGYYGRIMDRYLRVLGDTGMYAALWDNIVFRYSWYQNWLNNPMGGRTLRRAASEAFGYLKDVISSPSPGTYAYDEGMDAYVNISLGQPEEGSDAVSIPFGVGRYPYTQFGDALGYGQMWSPLWFGSFWEKLGALVTLTDSTAYFIDSFVGEQLNIGVGTSLGFNTLFADEVSTFLGGVIAGKLDAYSGRMVQGKYVGPSVGGRQVQDVNLEPSLNTFTLKLWAAVYGLANLPAGFDPAFIDRLAVFVEGEASHYDHETAGVVEHRFADPIGGKTYIAYSTNYSGFGEEKVDVGVELVNRAQDLADQWESATGVEREALENDLHRTTEVLDVLRGLHHIYGTSVLGL